MVLVDGAQAAPHLAIDVQDLDCDFYVLSSHKMFGPTGVGVLYGRTRLLESMPPYQGGGDMIASVTFEKTKYNQVPYKFEAGTPNIAGVAGFGAAIDYLSALDRDAALAHEDDVLAYATAQVSAIPGVRIIGEAREKTGVLSFVLDGAHPHDAGHDPRSAGHCGAHRPALRAAGDGSVLHSGHHPRFAGDLQHARGHRRAGARAAQSAGGFR